MKSMILDNKDEWYEALKKDLGQTKFVTDIELVLFFLI
jgi:hypothetical protein